MHTKLLLENLMKETTWETEALRLGWEIDVKITHSNMFEYGCLMNRLRIWSNIRLL
jgi:hypothetical protein